MGEEEGAAEAAAPLLLLFVALFEALERVGSNGHVSASALSSTRGGMP